MHFRGINFNLGIPRLLPEWKALFSTRYFGADLIAGTTVAFVAIPLSLAIALASGFSPGAGLITAIIAGIVCALFGGAPLAVSGPAAAMSVLIADNVEKFGVEGVAMLCLLAGLMQLLSGMFGLGKLGRYVPLPVIAGFTAGIGVIILIGQLPRAFGLLPPAESHTFDVLRHLIDYYKQMNFTCFFLVISTIVIIRGLPKILPKIPAILPAVAIITAIVFFFRLSDIPLIGSIPRTLPLPSLPSTKGIPFDTLLLNAFTIYILASLETLLSSTAVDKMTGSRKHDSDQELIGQGLGNITVSFFAGIPVTGVIARSATNVRAGAKTRRSSIIHALLILLTVFAIAPLISLIPIAALAGVLFSVAFSMISYKEFYDLWVNSRAEAFIYGLTFLTIIFVDLVAGVQVGIAAATLIVLVKAVKTHMHISSTSHDGVLRLSITGSLTFLASGEISSLEKELNQAKPGQTVILDLSNVSNMDSSGAGAIVDLYNHCNKNGLIFYMKGLQRRFEPLFIVSGDEEFVENHYIVSENDLRKKKSILTPKSAHGRLLHGVERFYAERKFSDRRLFEYIAKRQNPHTLFIACSDSRIVPSMITSSDPGELFIVRNIGNVVPPYDPTSNYSESAAIEFSLANLDITDIVICGHTHCGAIKAARNKTAILPHNLQSWISMIREQLKIGDAVSTSELSRQNVLNQIKHLKEYPIVKQKLEEKSLTIHGWLFDFDESLVYEYNRKKKKFEVIQ